MPQYISIFFTIFHKASEKNCFDAQTTGIFWNNYHDVYKTISQCE